MQEFTVLMVVLLMAIYLASCVLKRQSLIYLTLIVGVCSSAAVLMDLSLSKNELLVLALIP